VIRKLKLPSFLQILLGDIWLYGNLPRWLRKTPYAMCLFSHPYNFFMVKLLERSRTVQQFFYDDCDFFPDGPDVHGPLARWIMGWKERLAVRHSGGVTSVSHPLAALRKQQGAARVMVVPNGVDLARFRNGRAAEAHAPTLIYTGLLAAGWGVDLVIQAIPAIQVQVPDVRFVVVGSGPQANFLADLTRTLALEDVVSFVGKCPYDQLPPLLKQADLGVAIFHDRPFNRYGCHLKIRDYLAAGLPVIASRIGEAEQIIESSDVGELVDNTPESIAQAAVKILCDSALREQYTQQALRQAVQLDWRVVLEPLPDFLLRAPHDLPVEE
jgi:glycosyltransferase involved in cell wall biosynthesis